MKKLFSISLSLLLLLSLFVIPVSAAETYSLVPTDGAWEHTDNGGASCNVAFADGVATFSGSLSGTWPEIHCAYATDFIVNIDEYSLVYDFTVAGGSTNISFYFTDEQYTFPLANSALEGDFNYDTGSGDLYDGTYAGVIKLSDFVNSSALLGNTPFDKSLVSPGNTIAFCGIVVYSVNGAVITVNQLELVPNDQVVEPETSVDAPVDESVADESTETEAPVESTEESAEESAEASVEESVEAESSVAEASEDASVADTSADADDSDASDNGIFWFGIIAAVVVVAVIVAIVIKKKNKK